MADCVAMPLNWINTLQLYAIRSCSSSFITRERPKPFARGGPGMVARKGATSGEKVDGKPSSSGFVTFGLCEALVFRFFDRFALCPISHFTNHWIRSSLSVQM